jgi:hypothetical protein
VVYLDHCLVWGMAGDMGQTYTGDLRVVKQALSLAHWLNALAIDTIAIAVVLWVSVAAVFIHGALDTETPFAVLDVTPAEGYPGKPVVLHSRVWRDTSRQCDVEIDRYIWVSVRSDAGAIELRQFPGVGGFVPAKEIARREASFPGRNIVTQVIPDEAVPGPGIVVTHLRYYCNAAHRLWKPIEYTYEIPFTVLGYFPWRSSDTTATPSQP